MDEESEAKGGGGKGLVRLEHERRWLALTEQGVPVHVFRCVQDSIASRRHVEFIARLEQRFLFLG